MYACMLVCNGCILIMSIQFFTLYTCSLLKSSFFLFRFDINNFFLALLVTVMRIQQFCVQSFNPFENCWFRREKKIEIFCLHQWRSLLLVGWMIFKYYKQDWVPCSRSYIWNAHAKTQRTTHEMKQTDVMFSRPFYFRSNQIFKRKIKNQFSTADRASAQYNEV